MVLTRVPVRVAAETTAAATRPAGTAIADTVRRLGTNLFSLGGSAAADDEARNAVAMAWQRLVDRGPGGMGKVYKALAILPENDGRRRPVGFGGDVEV